MCALVTGVQTCALPILLAAVSHNHDRVHIEVPGTTGVINLSYQVGDRLCTGLQIGRASCRERVGQYVSISVVAVSLKQKHSTHTTTPHNTNSSTPRNPATTHTAHTTTTPSSHNH